MSRATRSSKKKTSSGENLGRYHHGNLKASLVNAAKTILERDGADALSLRAIAAEVGVSHTAPYSHFKNKRELIEAITEMGYELLADTFSDDSAGGGKDDVVRSYGASYLQFALENPQLYRLMMGQVETRGLKEPLKQTASETNRESVTVKRPFLMLKQALEKELGDSEVAKRQALGAWALVHGLSALLIEGHITLPDNVDLSDFLGSVAWRR